MYASLVPSFVIAGRCENSRAALRRFATTFRLVRLVQCNLKELAKVCDIDATSLSRALRPLIANGWVKYGRGSSKRITSWQTLVNRSDG